MYLTITLVYGICLRNSPSWEGQGWVSSDLATHPSGSRYRVYTPNPFSQGGEGEPDSKSLSLLGEGFRVRAICAIAPVTPLVNPSSRRVGTAHH